MQKQDIGNLVSGKPVEEEKWGIEITLVTGLKGDLPLKGHFYMPRGYEEALGKIKIQDNPFVEVDGDINDPIQLYVFALDPSLIKSLKGKKKTRRTIKVPIELDETSRRLIKDKNILVGHIICDVNSGEKITAPNGTKYDTPKYHNYLEQRNYVPV